MNRRKAVVNLLAASGGWITLPFWMTACRMTDKDIHLSSFSEAERQVLAGIVDTIIPAGGAGASGGGGSSEGKLQPGALAAGVDKYLQKLIDDCYEQAARENVKQQLNAVDEAMKAAYGGSFATAATAARQAILQKFADSPDKAEKDFFGLMKSETIRGFNTSQQVMEGYLSYKIAPGHYYGCVPVKS
jgi:Gluconate 2-dehydrogenase subunit 3